MSCWFHSSGHLDDLGCLKIGKPTKHPIWFETRPSQIVNTYICMHILSHYIPMANSIPHIMLGFITPEPCW
jgi:hypothetical protein